jgi:NAD(P)H-nitrite reductase large subunit
MCDNSDLIICRCEEVGEKEIIEIIKSGVTTIVGIKRRTRAGMGLCQGRRCRRLIAKLIAENSDKNVGEILPARIRPPVKPIRIKDLSEGE